MPEPPGIVVAPSSTVVSPAKLLKIFITDNASREIVPHGAVVGGADDVEQQAGVVALMDAGNTKDELYAPLLWKRVQVRCMGGSLYQADQIGNHVFWLLHGQRWMVMEDEAEFLWFVHGIHCTAGPSHHIDSSETWENLFFANITVGRDPVGVPSS